MDYLIFLRFLKEKQLYYVYFYYFYSKKEILFRRQHKLSIDFKTFASKISAFHLLISAFNFYSTKEKDDYWYNIHLEWEKYYHAYLTAKRLKNVKAQKKLAKENKKTYLCANK